MAHMQHITKRSRAQLQIWHGLMLVSVLGIALLGNPQDSQAGWIAVPVCLPGIPFMRGRRPKRGAVLRSCRLDGLSCYVRHSWRQPLVRSLLLAGLWFGSGRQGPAVLIGWPWLVWLWQAVGVGWPGLAHQAVWRTGHWLLWQGQRAILVSYLVLVLRRVEWEAGEEVTSPLPARGLSLGLVCHWCGSEPPRVEVTRREEGGYEATLCGHFTLRVSGDDPFRARLLMLFLRLLDVPGQRRGSRRTRDGRTPFVRQMQAAAWFGLPHPELSRIEGYWQRGAWPEMLSQYTPEILTPELVRRITTVCATFPHWSQERVYRYLQQEGVTVSQRQVRQATEQSGWTVLRQQLGQRYHWTPETFHLDENWLVQELLRQIQSLQDCLETGQALPTEERIAQADVQALLREVGVEPASPLKVHPWLLRVQQVLFGQREAVEEGTIRCPECGTSQVGRKSGQGRLKRFYDGAGQVQEVAVYRYYCRNRACSRGSFTYLPPGLVPYSRHRLEVHLLAWQAYAWAGSTYRRVGQALQVSEMTVYRWVSAWGQELLPVAAFFGVIRSSGVVGVDEKYVLVPKSDKPAGKMRRWMYVYLAVDVYTYDLLHITLYPHNTRGSAQAFLLALRAKGYRPCVVVTDLRRDYGPVIAQVFPSAQHHECLFHAVQEVSRYLQKTWGREYAERQPAAEQVRQAVVHLLQADTRQTVQKRYHALLAQHDEYVQQAPALQWVFDFLEQHWPYLVNSVESQLIPATNNAVEMVIRRFDQHYQNFCGFESVETAQVYLGVFEKVYRFTPFSDDARPEIRGKSPLQLAGYDLRHMPMTWLCRGYSVDWAVAIEADHVPNS
jgi:transposase-like protein